MFQGSMKIVVDCLLTLKTHFMPNVGAYKNLNMHTSNLSGNASNIRWKEPGEHFGCGDAPQRLESSRSHSPLSSREEMQNSDSKFKRTLHTPVMAGRTVYIPPFNFHIFSFNAVIQLL